MVRSETRTARKLHRCGRCHGPIKPGERYVSSVASPDHDGLGNTFWWRTASCSECAERDGRSLNPQPECTCPVPPTGADLDLHVDGCPRENGWQPVKEAV